jgi:hypothetical protein
MRRATFTRYLALLATLAAAAPAAAQSGNQSDNSGPNITGSGPAGGSYQDPGLRSENELFARTGERVVFRTAGLGCAVRKAELAFRDSVCAPPATPAEQRVRVLLGVRDGGPDVEGVTAALAHGAAPGSPLGTLARALAQSLAGLMREREGCPADRRNYAEAPQWREAIRAFNDYVRHAPDEAFTPPAPELVAIHQALQSVVAQTLLDPRGR